MVCLSPVGSSVSEIPNRLRTLATFKEKLCKSFCIDSTLQPQVTIDYTVGAPIFRVSTVFVPVKAIITVVTQENRCGCNAHTQLFTENFIAAFQGQTGLPSSVNIGSMGRLIDGSDVNCGRARSLSINDSLVIQIVP